MGYTVEGGTGQSTTEGRNGGRSANRPPRPAVYYGDFPALVSGPDGRYCIRRVRRAYSRLETAAAYDMAQEQRWIDLVREFPTCTGVAPPERSPGVHAADYWRVIGEDLLPKPQPRIAPGYMLAGKWAYLEVGSPVSARFEHPTPLGLLTVDATSEVFVDWGDGTGLSGPHAGPGGPWPSGTITHYWTHARTYDVRVVQRWRAIWRLAGAEGRLDGLATQGSIPDFEVRDLQAVRNF